MRSRTLSLVSGLGLFVATLLLDQLSKVWALNLLPSDRPAITIAPFFNLTLVWNSGISFGLLAAHRQPMLLVITSLIIIVILLCWLYKNTSKLTAIALGCVMGGAIGNVIDRLRFGAVIDFLDFHIEAYHWPAFNLADSFIFIGVVLLCAGSMFMTPPTQGNTA